MTTTLSGNHLTIRITADAERIVSARLERRTVDVARLMIGRRADDIPRAFSTLLPICAAAHRVAASGAIDLATGQETGEPFARAKAVLAERVANGVWRLGLDITAACGMTKRHAPVLSAREIARAMAQDTETAASSLETLAEVLDDLDDVIEEASTVAARYPASAGLDALVAHAGRDPREALSTLSDLFNGGSDAKEHAGIDGRVVTSRGGLRHACKLADGVATDWTIHTPTDWIAAPGGPLETSLVGLPHGGRPLEAARFACALHDPCEEVAILFEGDNDA